MHTPIPCRLPVLLAFNQSYCSQTNTQLFDYEPKSPLQKRALPPSIFWLSANYNNWHTMCLLSTNENILAMKTKTTQKFRLLAGIVLFVMALSASIAQAQILSNTLAYADENYLSDFQTTYQPSPATTGDETLLLDDWMYSPSFWQIPPSKIVPTENWMFETNFWHLSTPFEWMDIPEDKPLETEPWMFELKLDEYPIVAFQAQLKIWVKKREFQVL